MIIHRKNCKRVQFRQIFSCLLTAFLLSTCQLVKGEETNGSEKKHPNIIVIYTDQQRYNTIQALGNEFISTPHLDNLVKEGTAFSNTFVTAPVCVPSRWSLHTGMYTTSHQTYSNHHTSKNRPETSLPLELKNAGYITAIIGKNHCFLKKGREIDIYDKGKRLKKKPEDKRSANKPMPWTVEEDPMHYLTTAAIDVMDSIVIDNKNPAFIWLSYLYPHTPYLCPEPYFSMYDSVDIPKPPIEPNGLKEAGKPYRQQFHQHNSNLLLPYNEATTMRMIRNYYGMVSMIDDEIGRLISYLEENNLRENTLLIFTSDHGDYMGDHGMYTKSPSMYDCVTRVPLIWSWPGIINENSISDHLISSTDIMPTILDLANLDIPRQVQGYSITPLLDGSSDQPVRDYVFSEYGIPGVPFTEEDINTLIPDLNSNPIDFAKGIPWEANPVALSGRIRMIRNHKWKFVQEKGGTNELYDMINDPHELINLANDPEYSAIQSELESELNRWKSTLPGIERDSEDTGQKNLENYINKRK